MFITRQKRSTTLLRTVESSNPILTRHAQPITHTTRLRLPPLSTSNIRRLSRSSGKLRCIFADCCVYT